KPTVSKSGYLTRIRISEKPRYSVKFAGAQLNCRRERLCGDAYEQFYDHEGRFCLVLSDGMGTGGRAAVDGAMTAALAGRMMQAGFGVPSILRIINSALIVKSGDESLSTLDTLRIDLFTGRLESQKAGAAPSFLYSCGRVTKISAATLPIGILRDIEAAEHFDSVTSGDWLIMVSDGVISDDSAWLEALISRLMKRDTDPQTVAREIVAEARERQGEEHSDDTTALVLQIC
ncbi:MAG: SpoIIE family protein phosphatase, partial [Acutalibacteraceae bacterium]